MPLRYIIPLWENTVAQIHDDGRLKELKPPTPLAPFPYEFRGVDSRADMIQLVLFWAPHLLGENSALFSKKLPVLPPKLVEALEEAEKIKEYMVNKDNYRTFMLNPLVYELWVKVRDSVEYVRGTLNEVQAAAQHQAVDVSNPPVDATLARVSTGTVCTTAWISLPTLVLSAVEWERRQRSRNEWTRDSLIVVISECRLPALVVVQEFEVEDDEYSDGTHKVWRRLIVETLTAFNDRLPTISGTPVQLWTCKNLAIHLAEREALFALFKISPRIRSEMFNAFRFPSPRIDVPAPWAQVERAMDVYIGTNEAQARAILAIEDDGFHLLEGFPGSGKTYTASYLVGKLISSSPPGTKILVTAPGHKALDSICRALMAGIPSSTGENFVPNIVRLGDREVMAESVWPRSLGALVETRLSHAEAELNALITDAANICDKLGALRRQMVQLGDSNPRHRDLVRDCATLEKQHQEALSEVKKSKLSLQRRKRAVVQEEIAVLADPSVDVVCSTLASCAKKALRSVGFHTLIVDDAARASELDTLIALGLGSRRVVLVGDRNLLPPPIFSSNCQVKGYDKSLFHRLAPSHHVPYLDVQYRMNPAISKLPALIYGHASSLLPRNDHTSHQVQDAPGMAIARRAAWHNEPRLGASMFFHVLGEEVVVDFTSFKNESEVKAAIELYRLICHTTKSLGSKPSVAILSFYSGQNECMKKSFLSEFGYDRIQDIQFPTVDGYHGQEADIVILSTVRTKAVDFLSTARTIVGLTRAKYSRLVLGSTDALRKNGNWQQLIRDCKGGQYVYDF